MACLKSLELLYNLSNQNHNADYLKYVFPYGNIRLFAVYAANKQQACGLAAAASCGMVASCELFVCKLVLLLLVAATLRLLVAATSQLLIAATLRLMFAATLRLVRFSYAN